MTPSRRTSVRTAGFVALCLALVALALAVSFSSRERGARHGGRGRHREEAAYERVFAADRVLELELEFTAEQLALVRADLPRIAAAMPPPPSLPPPGPEPSGALSGPPFDPAVLAQGGAHPAPLAPPPIMAVPDTARVPVTVRFEGEVFSDVEFSLKGNSSLVTLAARGARKLPFRLSFEPERGRSHRGHARRGRFFGFERLTFSPNFGDEAQLRERFVSETFERMGVAAARTAFVRVRARVGSARQFWGLYTLVEDPADAPFLERAFGSHDGNLYKPEGPGADWTRFVSEGFTKKNNTRERDFSDVERAIEALHAQTADRAAWRATLERVFDVDGFLRWLAVNTLVANWDAYGHMAHNYYLYGDPSQQGRLRWIPWDHNLSLGARPPRPPLREGSFAPLDRAPSPSPSPAPSQTGPRPVPAGPDERDPTRALFHADAGARWPLLSIVLADAQYRAAYAAHLRAALAGPLDPTSARARLAALHALVAPAVREEHAEAHGASDLERGPSAPDEGSPLEAFERSIDGPEGLATFILARRAWALRALDPAAERDH